MNVIKMEKRMLDERWSPLPYLFWIRTWSVVNDNHLTAYKRERERETEEKNTCPPQHQYKVGRSVLWIRCYLIHFTIALLHSVPLYTRSYMDAISMRTFFIYLFNINYINKMSDEKFCLWLWHFRIKHIIGREFVSFYYNLLVKFLLLMHNYIVFDTIITKKVMEQMHTGIPTIRFHYAFTPFVFK